MAGALNALGEHHILFLFICDMHRKLIEDIKALLLAQSVSPSFDPPTVANNHNINAFLPVVLCHL